MTKCFKEMKRGPARRRQSENYSSPSPQTASRVLAPGSKETRSHPLTDLFDMVPELTPIRPDAPVIGSWVALKENPSHQLKLQ